MVLKSSNGITVTSFFPVLTYLEVIKKLEKLQHISKHSILRVHSAVINPYSIVVEK